MPLDDDDLFDSPAQPKKPSNKIVYQPPGAQWSLDRLPEVESLYQSSFKKRLPLTNRGQGSIHNKWGYDHRNSADVSINPATPEGQRFVEQLKQANIPFLAFTGAIPGVATGPHVHIGFPSQRTQQKIRIGTQGRRKSIASDDLFDPAVLESGNINLNKRPRVRNADGSTSTVRSISVNVDGREVLIPTVSDDGRIMSNKEAVTQYRQTGKHLGIFANPQDATRYANRLHGQQERQMQPDDDLFDSSEQSPPSRSADATPRRGQKTAPTLWQQSSAAYKQVQQPKQSKLFQQLAQQRTIDQQLRANQSAQGVGELRRLDDREAARIQNAQQVELASDPFAKYRSNRLTSPQAQNAAQRAVEQREDGLKAQANEPRLQQLTAAYRKEIQRHKGLGIGPEQWLNEAAAKGAAGLVEFTAGAFRDTPALAITSQLLGDPNRADIIALHAQAMQRAAEEEGADRNRVSKAIQNVVGGTIGSAPEMGMIVAGAPPMAAFGLGGATRARGRGERPREVVKAGAHGVATGGAFQLPIPAAASPLTRVGVRTGTTGLATGGLEASQGAPLDQAVEAGITNALMAGVGEVSHIRKQPSSLSRGLEREAPREQAAPDAEVAARLRGEHDIATRGVEKAPVPDLPSSNTVRFYRADTADAPEAMGKGWSTSLDYVSQKYGAGAMGGKESIWYIDVPKKILDAAYGDWRSVGVTDSDALRVSGVTVEPKLYRRTDEPQVQTKPPVEAERQTVEPAGDTTRVAGPEQAVSKTSPEATPAADSANATTVSPARFFHRDYGEVTESPNQKQVGKGRVRVVAEDGREHVVKRPTGTGAGNQRAVQIKETPVWEVPAEPLSAKPTTEAKSTTAVKNAAMAEDRAQLGLPELEQSGVRNAQEVHAQAVAANRANPRAVDTLVAEANSGTKNYTDVETAQVRLRAQEIKNRIAELDREIVAAKDEAVVLAKQAEVDALTAEFDRLSEATHKAGTEWGRAGVARQQAIDEDFSLPAMTARVRADKLKAGKGDLTEAEKSEIKELYRKHEELETQLLAANEQLAQQRLQTEIDRVSQRRQRRTQSKQTLDEEFVQLKADLSQALAEARRTQPGILASLDPEGKLTPIIAKMARNRIKAGVVDATQLVDDVYTAISQTLPGVTKREVRDAISGYSIGPKSTRSELQKQVDALKSELKGLSKEEDIAAGRRSSRQEGPAGEFQRDQARQRQLQKQIAELESRINRGDFSDNPKREPPPRSRETQRLEKERERIRNQYEELRFRAKLGRWGYALHTLSGLRKSWILSGPSTQVKNIGGTGGYQLFDEVSRLPAVIVDAAVAPITGQRSITGPSPVAMLDSALHAYKKGGREAVEIMKTGATKEQLERHQFNEINTGVKLIDFTSNLVFRFMSASDRVFYEYAYKRNLTDRAKVEAKNTGKSVKELTNNPPEELIAAAKHDALVSTFNNNNRLSDAIRRGRSSLGPEANFAIDMIMPFDRTPTNVVMRIVEASPVGAGRATYKFVKAIINKSLTQEQQRQFSQTMGRATVGTALMGLGWTLADDILEVDRYRVMLKLGSYRIDLASISPVGNLLALGARLRESYDKGDQFDAVEAVGSVPLQQPLIKGAEDVAGLLRRPRETLTRGAGRLATSFIPFSGMAKFVGETLDPKEREAKGFKEQFQRNVPLWRQQLPEYVDRRKQRTQLGEGVRMGRKSPAELEQMVREGQITESRKQQILRDAKVSEKQARFNDYTPSVALDRFERMDAAQREEVREQMEKKAYNLTHSDTLTERQKAEFQQRLDRLGIVPRGPKKSSGGFKDLFKQSVSPF